MSKSLVKKRDLNKHEDNKDENLKGTFVSVMLLGGFLILSWVGVWVLYLIR